MSVKQHFVFRFRKPSSNESREVIINNKIGESEAYNEARDEITQDLGISIREFESQWMLHRKDIALGLNLPENKSRQRFVSDIENIEGVEDVEAFTGNKGYKWQYNLWTREGINNTYIIDEVREIVPDEETQSKGDLLIVIDPPYHSK